MDDVHYTSQLDEPVEEPPRRVVSLVPSLTESLFDLGLGDRLVAVTDHCIYPEGHVALLPKVGAPRDPEIGRIRELAPDLVLASSAANRPDDIDALRGAGLAVWVTSPESVRDVFNLLWNIMHVFDSPDMVERIRSVEWVADWLERMALQREDRCHVFAPIALEPQVSTHAGPYTRDLIRMCGGTLVLANDDAPVTLDAVAAAQPDVVLLPDSADVLGSDYAARIRQLDIPAARTDAIHAVDTTLLTWPGTRVARALNQLPALICPQEDRTS